MEKQNVVYLHNRVLFLYKKEWSADTHHNMDEPWEDYAEWKKLDTKDHILCGSTCTKCPEQTKSGGQELGEGAVGHFLGMRFLFGVMKMFWN